jgi:hypothetical protein
MDLINTSFLCIQLIEINKKYESYSFVDIDFIDLYGLNKLEKTSIDLNLIKKKIVTKYYNLALKYHPDKYMNNQESVINIKNCFINIEEIKSGLFLSFVNDIYELLLNLIIKEPESLINIINGNTEDILNKYDLSADHNNLKRRFESNVQYEYIKPSDDQINEFKEELKKSLIVESKLTNEDLQVLTAEQKEKREKIKIENIFTDEQMIQMEQIDKSSQSGNATGNATGNAIFNNVFDEKKDILLTNNNLSLDNMFETVQNIQPYNFGTNSTLSLGSNIGYGTNIGSLSNTISDLSEAFEPIRVNKNTQNQSVSYEELLSQRDIQDKIFKNAKQSKTINLIHENK